MAVTPWTENWYEVRPELPALPSWWYTEYGIAPTYSGSGAPQGSGWTAKFDSDGSDPCQTFRLPPSGMDRLEASSFYIQGILYPPTSGTTRFEIGPVNGTRINIEYYSGAWWCYAGAASVDIGAGPWAFEIAYVPSVIPAIGESAELTWTAWARINGTMVSPANGWTATATEYHDATYGLKVPYFRQLSGTSNAWYVSSLYGRYGITVTDAQTIFNNVPTWTPSRAGETLVSSLYDFTTSRIGGSGAVQIPLDPATIGLDLPATLQTYKGMRIVANFTGTTAPAYNVGSYLSGYVKVYTAATGGSAVTPDTGLETLSGSPAMPLNARYTGILDVSISAETFAESPALCIPDITGTLSISVEGGATTVNPVTYFGAGSPVCTWAAFVAAFAQLTMTSTGNNGHIVQMDAVYVSEYPTRTLTAPTIYPPSGEYKGLIYAGITAADGFIRFTTDGTDPTETSEVFTRGIRVAGPMTIKAVAELDGLLSAVTTATYTVTNADVSRIPSYPDAIMPLVLEQYKADNR